MGLQVNINVVITLKKFNYLERKNLFYNFFFKNYYLLSMLLFKDIYMFL